MTRQKLLISSDFTNETLAAQLVEMHNCMDARFDALEKTMSDEHNSNIMRFQNLTEQMAANALHSSRIFVTREELGEKLEDLRESQQTVKKALGVPETAKAADIKARPLSPRPFQLFVAVGASIGAIQILFRAISALWPSALHFLLG